MKINNIKTKYQTAFKGAKEAAEFRNDAKQIMEDIDKMSSIVDYGKYKDAQGRAQVSLQARMRKLLFVDTTKVGAKYATSADRSLLGELKKTYVQLEKEYSFIETFGMGSAHEIDRSEEVRGIDF
ncbi:hypothetical protein IJ531_06325 [bacterium]|nr:hypothetical protein [bacterium]